MFLPVILICSLIRDVIYLIFHVMIRIYFFRDRQFICYFDFYLIFFAYYLIKKKYSKRNIYLRKIKYGLFIQYHKRGVILTLIIMPGVSLSRDYMDIIQRRGQTQMLK